MPEISSQSTQGEMPSVPQSSSSNPSNLLSTKLSSTNNKNFYQSKGFIIVLLFFLGAWTFGITYYFMYIATPSKQVATTPPPTFESLTVPLSLILESPSDGMFVSDNKLLVKGKTSPNIPVVFYTETDQGSAESDKTGNFEGSIILGDGINSLTVDAYGNDGEEKSLTVDVVYDSSEISMSL